jgi:3-hydroxybutyryl-CoA dehydrogenase
MQLVVHTDEILKEELLSDGTAGDVELVWVKNVEEFTRYKNADGYIDLLFDGEPQRIEQLRIVLPKLVIVNSVVMTLHKLNLPIVRINAWRGFLKRQVVEASCNDEKIKLAAGKIFSLLNKRVEWVEDKPGFITARVIAMIVNEAWFALGGAVSTKEEIDTAMKLGVNYPCGPFEWCDQIGIKNIYKLLGELSKMNPRYEPAALLEKEASV